MNDLKKIRSVLIVDDEPGFRDLFRFHLEQEGIRVESARDGIEALEKLENGCFDIVFSDIHMPRMDGPTLLAKPFSMCELDELLRWLERKR